MRGHIYRERGMKVVRRKMQMKEDIQRGRLADWISRDNKQKTERPIKMEIGKNCNALKFFLNKQIQRKVIKRYLYNLYSPPPIKLILMDWIKTWIENEDWKE